ncbi:MAG: hypothetical protein U5O39_00320 [Gammaproteobacteria bacterium]|nr:hypothetical protein [Gammaproteobacteria bacterium]
MRSSSWQLLALRPKLDPAPSFRELPDTNDLQSLADWLDAQEQAVPGLVDGAAAHVRFADPEAPAKRPLCFLYLHGFSATWPETAPVTERLATRFGANIVQARLPGHGVGPEGMLTPAEEWLASVYLSWQIATRLGHKVAIVATSTGAPLSVWLASRPDVPDTLHSLLFMSPNFGIRSRFAFLLTAPLSPYWIHLILGQERHWEPINEAQARYWTSHYSNRALIEMQKVVDWAGKQDVRRFRIPLATMYMKNDPTIDPGAAIGIHRRWGGEPKSLIQAAIDPEEASLRLRRRHHGAPSYRLGRPASSGFIDGLERDAPKA